MTDAGMMDSGDDTLHILDAVPPVGWADGGPVSWRVAEFKELCGPQRGRLDAQINDNGTVLIGCEGTSTTSADDYLVFRDGRKMRTSSISQTFQLLADDSFWHRAPDFIAEPYIYRRTPDGGVIQQLEYKESLSATHSGWLSLVHWGTFVGEPYVAMGPDGGLWAREDGRGPIARFNEAGVGIGQTLPRKGIFLWKDGRSQSNDYGAQTCSPLDINESNLIVGERAAPAYRAALFWGREYHEASVPVGDRSYFAAVNNAGVSVGSALETNFPTRTLGWGIAWARGSTVVLDDLVRDAGYGCSVLSATDINDHNEIVGLATCGDAGVGVFSYYRLKLELGP